MINIKYLYINILVINISHRMTGNLIYHPFSITRGTRK